MSEPQPSETNQFKVQIFIWSTTTNFTQLYSTNWLSLGIKWSSNIRQLASCSSQVISFYHKVTPHVVVDKRCDIEKLTIHSPVMIKPQMCEIMKVYRSTISKEWLKHHLLHQCNKLKLEKNLMATSPCSETNVASWLKILLSSWIVDSTFCKASALLCM